MAINRKFVLVGLLILCLFLSNKKIYAQITYIPQYTAKNGLASNTCYGILQDKKGFIWVCTDAGVSRFDGTSFQNFSIEDGLPDTEIIKIKEDSKGRIWFISLNGQLSYYYNGKIYNQNNQKFLKEFSFNCVITSFFEDRQGNLWMGTNLNLILLWDGKKVKKFAPKDPKKTIYNNATIYQDSAGKIWTYCFSGVYLFNGKEFNTPQPNLINYIPSKIGYSTYCDDKNDILYFINNSGLKSNHNNSIKSIIKINYVLSNHVQGFFYYDKSQNELWLGSNNNIYFIDGNGKPKKIITNVLSSQIIKDNKNNIWIATNNGVYMYPNKNERLFIFNKQSGLGSDVIKSITKDRKNRLWLGLNNASINIINPENLDINKIDLQNKITFKNIKQLQIDANTIFFASDHGFGYFSNIYAKKPSLNLFKELNNATFALKNFSLSKDNCIAISLSYGTYFLKERLKKLSINLLPLREQNQFFKERSYHTFYDNKNNLWFSNVNGLFEFVNGKLIEHYKTNILLTKRITDIEQLNDGTLVLATYGYGVLLYKPGKMLKQITKNDGLINNICTKIFINNNQIWVATNKGINKIKYTQNKYNVINFNYGKELMSSGVNDIFIDNKNAYFASNDGLLQINKNSENHDNKSPKIYITSIFNNKDTLPIDVKHLKLSSGNNSLIFNYSAIDFTNNSILYRYRLNPNTAWIETKAKRLEFSSLKSGKYTFEVSAKTQSTNWSPPATVSFNIQKEFWQTIWFLCLIILLTAFIFYMIAVSITRKQKDKEQQQLLLKNKILLLEQQALQAMMNPHFIFNVMNAIQHFINTQNTISANKVLSGFAKLIRKNMDICTKSYITLDEELEYLNLYLSLEKNRFGNKLSYSINVDDNLDKDEILIPSMLLQPYVENAIWHGIMPKEEGGIITINIKANKNNHLSIEIKDNGVGIDNSLKNKKGNHTSKGMELTKERLNLLGKIETKSIDLNVFQNDSQGTTVQFSIPLN